MAEASQLYNKTHPFVASIKERYALSKTGSKKNTHHIVLDLTQSGITYDVGDSIGIYPVHDPELVQKTIQAAGATGKEKIKDKHTSSVYSFRDYLARKANITEVNRKLLSELAVRQTNPNKKEHLEFLLEENNKDAFKEYHKNHELWDALLEHPEVRFNPEELCHLIQPMLPRFYSIASSMKVVGEEVHLTVSYVKYISNEQLRLGVCSHYLCDMAPMNLATVPIYVQPHHGFTLPEDPRAHMIMIGPGTGVAPYRAFMQERMAMGALGKNWLFFGEWNRAYDYFYEDYWSELQAQGHLKIDLAFSRDQEHKIYVQHRMLEHAQELFEWIEKGAYIFVCGDAHRMAKDVDAVLHRIIQEQGNLDEQGAKNYMKRLRTEKRYLRDIY